MPDDDMDGINPEIKRRRDDLSTQLELMRAVAEESTKPEHSHANDFGGRLAFDEQSLVRIEREVEAITSGKIKWTIEFTGGNNIKGENIYDLLQHFVVQNREIIAIRAILINVSSLPLCSTMLNLSNVYRSASYDVSARDEAVFERLKAIFSTEIPARAQGAQWIFQWQSSFFAFFIFGFVGLIAGVYTERALGLGVWITPVMMFLILMIGSPLFDWSRAKLFRRVEFDVGYSAKMMAKRKSWREKAMWPVVVISGLALTSAVYEIARVVLAG